jgi:hypothetical protein
MDSLRFTDEQPAKVKWTYTFHAKNRLARLPLLLFVKSQWNGYMAVCMKDMIKHFASISAGARRA